MPLASCTAATASAAANTHASSDQARGGVGRVGPAVATATPTLAGTWRVSTGSMPAGTCSTVRPATPQNASRPEPPGRHTGLAGSGWATIALTSARSCAHSAVSTPARSVTVRSANDSDATGVSAASAAALASDSSTT